MMRQSLMITLLLNTLCIFTDAMKMIKDATDLGQDYYELTSGKTGKGAVWSENKIDVTKDFTISAQVYLGSEKSTQGSQGIAFVIQGIGAHHSNLNGNGRLGYANINSVLAVEIDTSSQGVGAGTGLNNYDDIAHDHMQIRCTGNKNEWWPVSDVVRIGDGPDGVDGGVEDNKYHSFRVEFTAFDKKFKVFFDDVMMIEQQLDEEGFKAYIGNYLRNNLVTVGFTASHSKEDNINSQRVRFRENGEGFTDTGNKIPKGVCKGPKARWSGDPHFTTFDGLKYDCQGAGEFVIVKDTTTNFEIRGRFQHQEAKNRVTVTRAVAFRTGVVGDPDISFQTLDGGDDSCDIIMYKDKEEHNITTIPNVAEIGTNAHLIYVYTRGSSISISYKYSDRFGCVMSVSVCLPDDSGNNDKVVGLLGTPNNDKTDDWMESTLPYNSITVPASKKDLRMKKSFDYCVDNWCVKEPTQSLFTYEENDTKDFNHYNKCGEEVFDKAFEDLFDKASEELKQKCNNDDACIIETLNGTEEDARNLKEAEEYLDQIATDPVSVLTYATETPTNTPTEKVSLQPSKSASANPTTLPSVVHTATPSAVSSVSPTLSPGDGAKTRDGEKYSDGDTETRDGEKYSGGDTKTRNDVTNSGGGSRTTNDEFKAAVYGDPHFKTWSGLKYDYHGICDLIMLKHPTFSGSLGMEIHIRTKKTRKWSYVSIAVVLIGKDSFEVVGESGGNTRWINTIEVKRDDFDKNSLEISGFPVSCIDANSNQHEYIINLDNKEYIELKTWKDMVRVDIVVNRNMNTFGGSLGLLGLYPEGTMVGRDGKTAISDYNKFGQEWQVLSSEPKIFRVVDGPQHPLQCEVPNKTSMRRRLAESIISREEAKTACGQIGVNEDEFDLCIFDVMAIGDKNAAGAY